MTTRLALWAGFRSWQLSRAAALSLLGPQIFVFQPGFLSRVVCLMIVHPALIPQIILGGEKTKGFLIITLSISDTRKIEGGSEI